jgi:hypothetical protein
VQAAASSFCGQSRELRGIQKSLGIFAQTTVLRLSVDTRAGLRVRNLGGAVFALHDQPDIVRARAVAAQVVGLCECPAIATIVAAVLCVALSSVAVYGLNRYLGPIENFAELKSWIGLSQGPAAPRFSGCLVLKKPSTGSLPPPASRHSMPRIRNARGVAIRIRSAVNVRLNDGLASDRRARPKFR